MKYDKLLEAISEQLKDIEDPYYFKEIADTLYPEHIEPDQLTSRLIEDGYYELDTNANNYERIQPGDTINYDIVRNYKLNGEAQTKLINKTQTVYEKTSEYIKLNNPSDNHNTVYTKAFFSNSKKLTNISIIEDL